MAYEYDLVILGGGSGGLVAASSMAQLGMKVLLVEKERLGGDCLWYGCVPSKALLAVAKRIHDIRTADVLGLPKMNVKVDFKSVMERMREVQKTIQPHDSPERFRKLGAVVEFGEPHFISKHEILLGKKRITFKYGIISTGASPFVPEIEGLENYLTNLNLFTLNELPKHLVIIGGGPIAVEMGQAFRRFGSKVTLLVRTHLLAREDPELAGILKRSLESEGITVLEETAIIKVENSKLEFTHKGKPKTIGDCSPMLIATGRRPNVDGLQLEQAGIQFDKRGIKTDKYLRTSARNIFAVGDVAGKAQFTHMAASHASTAVRNIITPILNSAAEERVIPRVTYTDPELAEVGQSEQELKENIPYNVLQFEFKDADRAIAQGEITGKMKVFVSPKGVILGAAILGPSAGELIMEYTLAMKHGISIKDIAATIHPYPTLSGASWTLAGSFFKKFLTEKNKKISQFLVRRL